MNITRPLTALAAALALAGMAWAQSAPASAPSPFPGFGAKPLYVSPVTGDDTREASVTLVTLAPGASSPPHTHPGDCFGMVIEGTIEMRATGQPPRRYAAGEAYGNLRGVLHQFTNVGDTPVRMVNTLILDKGKPRLEPRSEKP